MAVSVADAAAVITSPTPSAGWLAVSAHLFTVTAARASSSAFKSGIASPPCCRGSPEM
ncbi:hypothetical protein PF008_g26830 [Phytophthora fragariae]|uniref:Uncharacterized protein n=1 Tax=Phytophthora fragariae TaxID=53985 RepID=A0A6G0QFW2_9STRA|nr:hypothetical protein PF008_g26830 [Phytophthora fragariae]